jgi:mRNA-degrading endonuclease toxin of MazEF toxin-antitoxin module
LIWRGEVYYVDLGQPVGHKPAFRRPAVVVSVDILNNGPGGLVVMCRSRLLVTACEAMSNSSQKAADSTAPLTLAATNCEWSPSSDCHLVKE